ncbi:alpha/beta hydrolase [Streptosporangium sp. NPDC000396]|uniref:alpha/beta hydrolase n=1 Tax=Streptosporangium sp. NPDC000396 TaxID=3366185 RepID=UPI0036BECD4D
MRRILTTALVCTTLVALGGGGATAATAATAASGDVAWSSCTGLTGPDGRAAAPDPKLECGKLAVPLDYDEPDGETVDIALIRIKATGARIGSLVFNFGGPGASGVDSLAQVAKALSTVGARYDLVSFDPRGVERSSPVVCGTAADMERYFSLNTMSEGAAGRAKMEKAVRAFAAACAKTSGKILPHVGTVDSAHDLDRIREALGDPRLNYVGMSYGTHLGAVYATEYPEKVGRFVLDAPLDPTVTFEQRTLAQAAGFQQAYESFLADCVKQGCDLGSNVTAANRSVEGLLKRLRAKPLTVGGRKLTQGLATIGVSAALYSPLAWPMLEQTVAAGLKGDGNGLLALADLYTGRKPDGGYSTLMSSFPAISCVDNAERPGAAAVARTEKAARKVSKLFGGPGLGSICRMWPVAGSDKAKKVDATGSAPIVVIGTKGDPATPYKWAPKLTAQLKTGVLVTYEGEGHGAYFSGNRCVADLVNGYLLNGKTPKKGSTCAAR